MMKLKPIRHLTLKHIKSKLSVYLQIHNTFCKNNYLILIWYAYILRQ